MTARESIAALETALAAGPTEGPWFVVGHPWNPSCDFIVAGNEDPHIGKYVADTEDFDGEGENVQANAAFIAAANPAAIRSVLERVRELEAALQDAWSTIYQFHYAMKDAGWHPGRTDDSLCEIIRDKGRELAAARAESAELRRAALKDTP